MRLDHSFSTFHAAARTDAPAPPVSTALRWGEGARALVLHVGGWLLFALSVWPLVPQALHDRVTGAAQQALSYADRSARDTWSAWQGGTPALPADREAEPRHCAPTCVTLDP